MDFLRHKLWTAHDNELPLLCAHLHCQLKQMKKAATTTTKLPGVVYSHLETQRVIGEQFIAEHGLCYIVSGSLKVDDGSKTTIFSEGELVFYRKNFLAKFTKQPGEKGHFRSVTVIFHTNSLQEYNKQYPTNFEEPLADKSPVLQLKSNLLLKNYFKTLLPYFDTSLPTELVSLKRQEGLMLLLQVKPQLKNVLFDFGQPGKIDLEVYMQEHFHFNISLDRFAYLTGRSLSSFKRDFQKIFNTTPNRWLQQRRLEEAHYLIREKKKRPTDVYHEVGFETFSHFSYSFKQFYGINPSTVHN
jgi:AraC-like DNA-binding protein